MILASEQYRKHDTSIGIYDGLLVMLTTSRYATSSVPVRPRWAFAAAVVAVLFGILTVLSGGCALFGGEAARAAVGDAVAFVLWFNFVAGFIYVLAVIDLLLWHRWAAQLSAIIAMSTLVVFAAFGWHVATEGAFEMRTVGAMILRGGS